MNQKIQTILAYQKRKLQHPSLAHKATFFDTTIPKYTLALIDESLTVPICLNKNLVEIINNTFYKIANPLDRSKCIYDWVTNNILYGKSKLRDFSVKYRTATETVIGKEGVCGEMAYVYIAIARASGLKSNYVHVEKDNAGKRVFHACASVHVPHLILVDPAYKTYDIHHKEYKIMPDKIMFKHFCDWRGA